MNKIERLLTDLPIISTMVNEEQVRLILTKLQEAEAISGDVVELGCNIGTTSIFLQTYLNGAKKLHCYDSFEGFPEKSPQDYGADYHFEFKKGGCAVPELEFYLSFTKRGIPLPEIHKGWFKNAEFPEKISFAFFDSDFYTSIRDSWEKVYPRLEKGAIVCIHDYDWDVLPAVKLATEEFLADKPEKGTVINDNFIGIFRKL